MKTKEDQIKILEAQAEIEEVIGQLYQAYSGRFPDQKTFWTRLATDEARHASWVRSFRDKVVGGSVVVPEDCFQMSQLEAALNDVKDHLRRARGPALPLGSVLQTAMYIEHSLLETHLFEFLESDKPELKDLLARLHADTEKHFQALNDLSAGG